MCDHGYEPKGESCVKISCKQDYRVGDDNVCEKIESKRPVSKRESSPEPQPQRPAAKPTASASGGGRVRTGSRSAPRAPAALLRSVPKNTQTVSDQVAGRKVRAMEVPSIAPLRDKLLSKNRGLYADARKNGALTVREKMIFAGGGKGT